jgi:bifunctional non-homologous end joining protein LigD
MRPRPHEKKEQWLLIKGDDAFARAPAEPEITDEETTSIVGRPSHAAERLPPRA